MKFVIAVLLAVTSGLVNATGAAVSKLPPKIWVIKPRITIVQNMLDLVNKEFLTHTSQYTAEIYDARSLEELKLGAEDWGKKYGGVVSIANKISDRIEKLINTQRLVRLNGDELVSYKKMVEKEAIQQLVEERSISYKEILAQLRSLYEQGPEKYSEELHEMIRQLQAKS